MKTTVNIPDRKLREAMKNANTKIKTQAIELAIDEFNKRRRLARLADSLGKSDGFMSLEELMAMREVSKSGRRGI